MKERRRVSRFSLRYHTPVLNAETNQRIGNVMDISTQGLMVVTDLPIPIGETMPLRLPLDESIFTKPALEFTALSIWCHPDIEPRLYNVGFEILDLAPADAETISRLGVQYGI